jgi:hypothetical protein
MFGSAILEIVISLIFIFVLVSTICAAIREGLEAWLKTRAAYLELGIRELLHDTSDDGLTSKFYNHPLISSLFSGKYKKPYSSRPGLVSRGANLPSYIPTRNFALSLMDMAARGPATTSANSAASSPVVTLDNIRANVANLGNEAVQRVLLAAIDAAQGDFNKAQATIEAWYDSTMDRVSGWYKRSTQWLLFWISLVMVVLMNINAIIIADYLYRNSAAREVIVASAGVASVNPDFLNQNYTDIKETLTAMHLPIGWPNGWSSATYSAEPGTNDLWNCLFAPVLGWLLTAFAATLGAPFWFDVLNKVMVIRSTVKPHEKSPEEASDDRQPSRRAAENLAEPAAQLPLKAAVTSTGQAIPAAANQSSQPSAQAPGNDQG